MFKTEKLGARILRYIGTNGGQSAQQLSEAFGILVEDIVATLKELAEADFVVRNFANPDIHYEMGFRGKTWLQSKQNKEQASQLAELSEKLSLSQTALAAANNLLSELTADDGNDKAKYMVSVDGKRAPSVEHNTIEEAEQEAMRLASMHKSATIRILAVVDVLNVHTTEMTTATWQSKVDEFNESIRKLTNITCNGNCEGRPNNA